MSYRLLVLSDYTSSQASRPEAELFIRLAAHGVDIQIMTYDCDSVKKFEEAGILVTTDLTKKKFSRRFIRSLKQRITAWKPDIVFLFPNQAIVNGIIAAWNLPVKVVLYRGYTGNISWYDPTSYIKFLSPRVDKIVCIAQSIVEYLERQPFFRKGKAITINKGHDPIWYQNIEAVDRSELSLPDDAIVVSCMANARPFKGIRYLLEATALLADIDDLYVLLIGRDMNAPPLQRLHERSPMKDRIILAGYRTDALAVLKATDLFALPSTGGEAITKSLIEAMSLGLPPVITDIAGNRNLVSHQINGLVVPARDSEALARAIRRMVVDQPQLRTEYGRKAKEHIRSKFHINRTVSELNQLFEELLAQS